MFKVNPHPGKRYRRRTAKDNQIMLYYGKAYTYDAPDICVAWGKQAGKPTANLIMSAFCETHKLIDVSLIEELDRRGFDVTTIKFSIEKKRLPRTP